ncbi:MAG: DUF2752 domain-containing protein [Acidimicrobiia bacterium]|jgi:hypothetical protein
MSATWRDRLILVAPFMGVAVLALVSPSDDSPTICPFALCTGTACPGCGMTRAATALIRGDVKAAFAYHPLVLAIGIEVILGWTWFMLRRTGRVGPMRNRTLNVILAITTVALIAVWIVRIATGTLPPV